MLELTFPYLAFQGSFLRFVFVTSTIVQFSRFQTKLFSHLVFAPSFSAEVLIYCIIKHFVCQVLFQNIFYFVFRTRSPWKFFIISLSRKFVKYFFRFFSKNFFRSACHLPGVSFTASDFQFCTLLSRDSFNIIPQTKSFVKHFLKFSSKNFPQGKETLSLPHGNVYIYTS